MVLFGVLVLVLCQLALGFECPENGMYRSPDDCNRYFICDQTGVFEMQCPDTLYFNEREGVCDWPENVPECEFVCPGDGMFLDKTNCNMYWWCLGERKWHMPCPDGLWFNEGEQACDWPENVPECPISPPTPVPTPEPTTPEPTTPEPTTPEPTTPEPTTPEPTTPEPTTPEPTTPEPTTPEPTTPEPTTPEPTTQEPVTAETAFECPGEGRFLDKINCNWYWRCYAGRKFHMPCPDGLWFNEREQVCDWPENVPECPISPPTPEPTPEPTTSKPTPEPTPEPTTPRPIPGPTTPEPTTQEPVTGDHDCVDLWDYCKGMPSLCLEEDIATVYCRASCQRCDDEPTTLEPITGDQSCVDKWDYCKEMPGLCLEEDIATKFCRASCDLCDDDVVTDIP